jgi:UDP-4-amino-4,6-dideoxy-N-acetyl-beta-L-altrosamine transaminase
MDFIPYGRQWLDEADIQAVVDVLRSDFLTQGPQVEAFEKKLCQYTGARYAVAVANGTAALHLAVAALGLQEGTQGITTPNTFVASANCLVYNRLQPVFADIDRSTYNIDPGEIERKITPQTKVLVPVHFAGRPCDMDAIGGIAGRHNLFVIEDAAHAIGSQYADGAKVGNCAYSDMTTFSFHPVKTITTGEGGAITTNSPELYKKLVMLRSHGITRDSGVQTGNPGPWYYEMQDLGFNYRITDLQAALGSAQLDKVEAFKKRRAEIVDRYNAGLSDLSWLKTPVEDKGNACFHLYVAQIDFDKIGKSRAEMMEVLKSKNIGTQVHYIPVHTQPYYQKTFGYAWGDYPAAEAYYKRALSLPLYPKMRGEEVDHVISSIRESV